MSALTFLDPCNLITRKNSNCIYNCTHCDLKFNTFSELHLHGLLTHKSKESGDLQHKRVIKITFSNNCFKCPVCEHNYTNKRVFNCHVLKHLNEFSKRRFGKKFKTVEEHRINIMKEIKKDMCNH